MHLFNIHVRRLPGGIAPLLVLVTLPLILVYTNLNCQLREASRNIFYFSRATLLRAQVSSVAATTIEENKVTLLSTGS